MSDRRYSTARWQQLRKAVLARDGYACMLEGPGCTGIANTGPPRRSEFGGAALVLGADEPRRECARCNYSDGARLAAGNRRMANEQIAELKRENEYLARVVQTLEERIESLARALAAARNGSAQKPSGKPAQPAIY